MSTAVYDTRFPRNPTSHLSGVELFANAVWYRSKATLKGVLTRMHSNTSTDSRKARFFPPEIVEMIINLLTYDIPTLKACAATCFTWYNVTLPHLHDTLILREWLLHPSKNVRKMHPNPLPALHQLGLLPLIKWLQFRGVMPMKYWVTPVVFDSRNMQYFRAMVNLQELRIADLDFSKFPAGFGEHLGHFSPTLRSIALDRPNGSRRQLLGFFVLFPALDDIEISSYYARQDWHEALASKITPIGGGLQGRLTLHTFAGEGLLKDMIVAFGGFRFTSMDLQNVQGMSLLLEACANTLETLRLHLDYRPRPYSNLSCNTALRAIEVPAPLIFFYFNRETEQVLSSIVSPVFSEIVIIFSETDMYQTPEFVASVMREFLVTKHWKMAFCLEMSERSRAENLRRFTLGTERAVAAGVYDFLPSPPLVFSRTAVKHGRYTLC